MAALFAVTRTASHRTVVVKDDINPVDNAPRGDQHLVRIRGGGPGGSFLGGILIIAFTSSLLRQCGAGPRDPAVPHGRGRHRGQVNQREFGGGAGRRPEAGVLARSAVVLLAAAIWSGLSGREGRGKFRRDVAAEKGRWR